MGIAYANLELCNPVRADLAALPVRALADTGAMYLCIPRHVAIQLGLSAHQQREVMLAAIPMEDMDLVVHPQTRQVTVHPDRPNIAAGIAKRAA